MNKSPYDILEVPEDAPPEVIKKAFRRKAKLVHPDVKGGNKEAFIEAEQAYAILANPIRREKYDQTGQTETEADFRRAVVRELKTLAMLEIQMADWRHDDLFQSMKQAIKSKIKEFKKKKADHEKTVAQLRDCAARSIRKDKGENAIALALENEMRGQQAQIQACNSTIEVFYAMIEEINNYQWRTDQRDPMLSMWAQS